MTINTILKNYKRANKAGEVLAASNAQVNISVQYNRERSSLKQSLVTFWLVLLFQECLKGSDR